MRNHEIVRELTRIAERNGGILRPDDVVEAARSPQSVLHSHFDWDDSDAAHKWRIHQARNLINVVVSCVGDAKQTPMRVFVSLTSDRVPGGGYRLMTHVLSDRELREQMLKDALLELQTFETKYKSLMELARVFAAARSVRRRLQIDCVAALREA